MLLLMTEVVYYQKATLFRCIAPVAALLQMSFNKVTMPFGDPSGS